MLSEAEQLFVDTVWSYYAKNARDLPWRHPEIDGSFDSYRVLVSELMLQQTQVSRVIDKYDQFIKQFPDIQSLADAPLAEVLRSWQGLGYNRRAKYLHDTARQVINEYQGILPTIQGRLVGLPGIGPNTAGAILAYAYNQPEVFVETNIRTVFIYHFFQGKSDIADQEIVKLIERTLPGGEEQHRFAINESRFIRKDAMRNPKRVSHDCRNWYWALMDYGTYLKKMYGNPNTASKHYIAQSPFQGSVRQVRGRILQELAAKRQTKQELSRVIPDVRLPAVLEKLVDEGLIQILNRHYYLGRG
jgi:A/G-specific adenine glycosylase